MKISLIIPAKNEEKGLLLVLPKLKKFFKDVELIVVDDGSNDSTYDVCMENQNSC